MHERRQRHLRRSGLLGATLADPVLPDPEGELDLSGLAPHAQELLPGRDADAGDAGAAALGVVVDEDHDLAPRRLRDVRHDLSVPSGPVDGDPGSTDACWLAGHAPS
jgi:hypothetical protein